MNSLRKKNSKTTNYGTMTTFKFTNSELLLRILAGYNSSTTLVFIAGLTTSESELSFREKRSVDSSLDLSDGNALVQEPEVRRRQQTFRDRHRMELYIIPGK